MTDEVAARLTFRGLQIASLVGIVLWACSLAMPAFTTCADLRPEVRNFPAVLPGWQVLAGGWSGPMMLYGLFGDIPDRAYPAACAALLPPLDLGADRADTSAMLSWYANPLWLFATWRMVRGRRPGLIIAVIAALLGILALQPHTEGFDHGPESENTPAIGAYVWAIAMTLPLLSAVACGLIVALTNREGRDAPARG